MEWQSVVSSGAPSSRKGISLFKDSSLFGPGIRLFVVTRSVSEGSSVCWLAEYPSLTLRVTTALVDDSQFNGNNVAANSIAISPVIPIKMLIGVTKRKPSASVMPLILQITQKPLSFIQPIGFEPQPMASARYTG